MLVLAKGIKSKQKDQAVGFTKEVIGMALLLFSILSFLCFITGDVIFYTVGSAVQGFFFGLFGYFAFFVLFGLILLGLRLVIGRPIFNRKTRKYMWLVSALAFFVLAIVHLAIRYDKGLTFGQNFSHAYGNGLYSFATATPCGGVAVLLLQPVSRLASVVGAYIVLSILVVLNTLLIFRDAIRKAADKARSQDPKPERPARKKRQRPSRDSEDDVADQPLSELPSDAEGEQLPTPTLPNYIVGDFGIKSKRDYKTEKGDVEVFSGTFNLRGNQSGNQRGAFNSYNDYKDLDHSRSNTYSDAYRRDLSPEANYIMTPPPFNPEYLGNRPMSAGNSYTEREAPSAPATRYDNTSLGGTAYTVPNGRGASRYDDYSFRQGAPSRANDGEGDYGAEGRGGLFDNTPPRTRAARDGYDVAPQNDYRAPSRQFGQLDGIIPEKQEEADGLTNEINNTFTAERGDYRAPAEEIRNVPGVEKAYTPMAPNTFNPAAVARNRGEAGGQRRLREGVQPTAVGEDLYQGSAYRPSTDISDRGVSGTADSIGLRSTDRGSRLTNNFASDRGSRITNDGPTYRETEVTDGAVFIEEPPMPAQPTGYEPSSGAGAPTGRASTGRASVMPQPTNVQPFPVESATTPNITLPEEDEDDGSMSIDQMPLHYRYKAPPFNLLNDVEIDQQKVLQERARLKELAEDVAVNFGMRNIPVTLENIVYGMSVTRFEYSIPTIVSVRAITSAQNDLNVWLQSSGDVRIIAPIPGTSRIGIEVPNKVSSTVVLKDILRSPQFRKIPQNGIHITLGKNIMGESVFLNLTGMPHLLVAGATGTGKSVFLNSLLVSLLYTYSPEDLRIVIVDPKQLEFVEFEGIPHLLFNKIITKGEEAAAFLNYLVNEMDNRYALFAKARVKKISEYNESIDKNTQRKLPYIVLIIDEFADLMMKNQSVKKSMEQSITRLAALARAAGISLVFATQRPTTDVIDGTIKNNFPARICFKTADYTNSQVVLDERGAEKLLGKGDLLYKVTGATERAQGALVEGNEIRNVVKYIKDNNKCYYDKECLALVRKAAKDIDHDAQEGEVGSQMTMDMGDSNLSTDPQSMPVVYRRAVRLVITQNTTSKSMLQTKLGIGYNKAARIIDWMERENFISCVMGNKQREILIDRPTYETIFGEKFNEDYLK